MHLLQFFFRSIAKSVGSGEKHRPILITIKFVNYHFSSEFDEIFVLFLIVFAFCGGISVDSVELGA